jgi:hypothetical protein
MCSYEIMRCMWDEHNEEGENRKMELMKLNFRAGHRIEMNTRMKHFALV